MPTKETTDPDTDAITAPNTRVLGDAPAMAMASLFQTSGHALGMAAENAASAQNNGFAVVEAATTQLVEVLTRRAVNARKEEAS
ncbi:RebB family R body protein [Sagittula sp. S175]|uniref:RebB family R body protein n=1 Tax=Sagittula sp. S175 TaxID=3415129 RepID=UPI003C7E2744